MKSSARVASVPSAPAQLRQILPESGSVQLTAQVQFRWRGAGSRVQLARRRNFSDGYEELAGVELGGDPELLTATSRVLADGIWFWRIGAPSGRSAAVWSFRVHRVKGVSNAGSLRDGWDINCDGRADALLVGAVALGGDPPVTVSCDFGTLAGKDWESLPTFPDLQQRQLVGIGDVDGDGCDDAIATIAPVVQSDPRPPVRILFRGQPGLTSQWQAARRSGHEITPVGDITLDGYADGAECAQHRCRVYFGSRVGLQEQPSLSLEDYDALLGGDFDADGLADLWAVNKTGNPGPRLGFFSGKTSFSAAPTSAFSLPSALSGGPLTGLIVDGKSTILGFAGSGSPDWFWRATHSSANATLERWSEVAHAWSKAWAIDSWAFVPFVGPGARGMLAVTRHRLNEFDPTQSFLQYGFTAGGTPVLLGQLTVPGLEPNSPIVGFAPVGDMNGDGYDELLVQASDDNLGTPLWYEFSGSEIGFKFERRL